MATAQQSPDRLTSSDSAEALNVLILDATKKPADSELLKDQDMVAIGSQKDDAEHSGSISPGGGYKTTYSANAYSFHGQPLYNGGHDDTANVQGACLPYFHAEGLENGSYEVRSESPSLAFHGYGLRPLMPHRSYAHVTTQQPYMRGRGQLYEARNFSTSYPPYFQQTVPPNIPYIAPRTQVSTEKLPVDVDLQADGKQFWPRAYCPTLLGPSGRGSNLSGNSGELGFMHQGLEGSGVGGLQSDWSKLVNRKSSLFQLSASAAASKPIDSLELFENDFEMASQQKRSFYGFGSSSRLSYRGYPHSRSDRGFSYGSLSCSNLGMNSVNWPTLDEARQGGRCNDFSCSCSVTLDTLSERNRGPRAFKPKGPTPVNGPTFDNSRNDTVFDVHGELYNRLDFVTEYKNAKFFVIKSYSEDNVHKSIKYGVWASTPNGNKKLDAAYREANEKPGRCPIFLFFSVNASAQFCGVAEMVGPVDFDKSVDYWLQDKWSGQFPVKWHLIKDVPNSQFRHIILENNDNKPVTNSRDTQEVELAQGVEMLNLFKKYETYSSILDDFYFYEERQKAMQERKARHQASPASAPVAVSSEQNPILGSSALVNKMSKSFAEALVLNDQK